MGSMIAQALIGVVLPALLALVLNGLVLRARTFSENRKWALIGLVVACCFAVSYGTAFGGIAFPPRDATQWLPYTAIGSLLFGIILMLTSGAVRSIARLVAALGTAWTILQLQFGRWPLFVSLEWLVAITLFFFATPRLIERFGDSRSTEVLLGMTLAAVFGGVALFLGGSALVGQICGAFGLVLAGSALLTLFKSPSHLGPTMPLVFVLVF
ncbi:MAG TPA: hypothetical protein VE242_10320, partial [Chthoniobacterales bacterium]|nr:hypothetical protein [Chthoniobacterales bacterium]